ncbi:MAG: hypothetical protein ACK4ZY_07280 [Sphingomonas sp.]
MAEPSPSAATHRRWTGGDIAALRMAVGAEEPVDAIADRLLRSVDDVVAMARRFRLPL